MDACQSLLEDIVRTTCDILGEHLTGIYLHGSLAMDCFSWAQSDIDYLIVVEDPLTLSQKQALIVATLELNERAPQEGLEMSVVLREHCAKFTHPTPFELHYSNTYREDAKNNIIGYCQSMNGEDADLAAHFTVIVHRGQALWGAPIGEVFGEVDKEAYLASLVYDLADAIDDILKTPVDTTLNLCRTLAFVREGLVLSKNEGGAYGLAHLSAKYHGLIDAAMASYLHQAPIKIDEAVAIHFAQGALDEILAFQKCPTGLT